MLYWFFKRYLAGLSGVAAIAMLVAPPAIAQASPSNRNLLTTLPERERVSLKAGEAVVSGGQGRYVGRVLINAPATITWNVLTDYDNFKDFLPGVVSSRILSTQGNTTIFEQVNQVQVLLFRQTNRLVMTAVKQFPQKIEFQLKEGAVRSLQGNWMLNAIAPNQMLITQNVTFDPGDSNLRELAFTVYRNALSDSLTAIKQESERRARQR